MASTRRISLIAGVAAVVAVFALPEFAGATVYCVPDNTVDPSCQTPQAGIQSALDAAESNAGDDTVRIGPGTFTGTPFNGFSYLAGDGRVSIIGAGQGQTTLTVPPDAGTTFTVNQVLGLDDSGGGSSVSDLSVALPTPSNNDIFGSQYRGVVLFKGEATRVTVTAPVTHINSYGFWVMDGPVTISDSTVSHPLDASSNQIGVLADAEVSIEDSTITANHGVLIRNQPAANHNLIRTSVASSSYGISVDTGTINLASSEINLGSFNGKGVQTIGDDGVAETATLNLDHATIAGTHSSFEGVVVRANDSSAADTRTATITNSVISAAVPIERQALNSDVANVTTDYSNYNAGANLSSNSSGGTGTISETNQTNFAPGFVDPATGNYHLLSTSPLIDIGDPTVPSGGALDIDGDPRALSGVASCTSPDPGRRDIGADEFSPTALNCAPPISGDASPPETSVNGKPKVKTRKKKARVTWTFASTEPGSTFACSLDGAPFAPCASPFAARVRRGSHTLSVRATDAVGNTDPTPASFTTKVKRKRR
jgi:hypothetical protein